MTDSLARIGGPIALTDQTGRAVTQADFEGKPTAIYFGFATCPDVCPLALQALDVALGEKGGDVQTVLITVDPERDTPQVLASYVTNEAFPAGLVGLTGKPEEVNAVADSFKILRQKRKDEGSALGYTIDHSSYFYLMDRNWRTAAVFPSEMAPEDMAACIDRALEQRG